MWAEVKSKAYCSCATSNQRVGSEGRGGKFTLFMSQSFPSLILEDPRKATQKSPKEVKDLCTENHRTVLKKEDTNTWNEKITAGGNCSHEIKRCLLLERKVMTNLDSIFKAETLLCQQRSI